MPKLNILVKVKSDDSNTEYTTPAIFADEVIKYKSKDNTLEIFDYKNNILIRENNKLRMEYIFDIDKKTLGTIYIKELNNEMKLNIETNKIERNNNDLDIEFKIENNIINYHIEVVK